MGAWSAGPFGNDTALDWLARLERAGDPHAFIERTIGVIGADRDGSAPEEEDAIAAIAVVSAAAVAPIGMLHKAAKAWITHSGFVPDASLVDRSLSSLRVIREKSEIRALWEESGRLAAWLAELDGLAASLEAFARGEVPRRPAERRAAPRLLHRLVERYAEGPSAALREKIGAKIDRLEDPNAATGETDYKTPLALVAEHGLDDEVRMLLDKGADPDAGDIWRNPFAVACVNGHLRVAQLLYEAGASIFREVEQEVTGAVLHQMKARGIEPKRKGYTYCPALFSVALHGTARAAEYLVGLGASLEQTDLNDEGLLHKASESGNVEMIAYLVASGVDVDKVKGTSGESPLHYAVRNGQVEAVAYLLSQGANPNVIDKFEGSKHRWYETPLDLVQDRPTSEIYLLLRRYGGLTASEVMDVP